MKEHMEVAGDWSAMSTEEFARLTEGAFGGRVTILPNHDVRRALASEVPDGDVLRVVDNHDAATAYEIGDGGTVLQIAHCCNETSTSVDMEEFESDGFSPADYDRHHVCAAE